MGDDRDVRVLVVDDDEMVSVALFEYLIERGIGVDRAVDPVTAVKALRARPYDVVVVDAYMTGQLRGRALDLVGTLQSMQPRARVVVHTAYGSAALLDPIRAAGTITVVSKPQTVAAMAEVVTSLLAAGPPREG
jgi:DNA-binding NtrC family response regulator